MRQRLTPRGLSMLSALVFLTISMTCGVWAEEAVIANGGEEFVPMARQSFEQPARLLSSDYVSVAPVIALPKLSDDDAAKIVEDRYLFNKVRIGVNREIIELQSMASTTQMLDWRPLDSGGVTATLKVVSPGAAAVRLAIRVHNVPENSEFRFFSGAEGGDIILVTGTEIMGLIDLNRQAEPTNPDGSLYWGPTISGDSVGVEIYLPSTVELSSLAISMPAVSHMSVSPFVDNRFSLQDVGDSNPCQNDATCYSSWLNMRKATAKMIFNDGVFAYICTGTLLNDKDTTTFIPYFLSANHCISTQTEASTLETLWFFESATCNGATRNPNYNRVTGGAALLWTGGMTSSPGGNNMDTSFFRLNGTPSGGVYFAGWTTAIPIGNRTGVHHPSGDWKKISFGTVGASRGDCWWTGETSFECQESASGNFILTGWNDGGTEGGSSGSGIFENNDQLAGDLTGGGGGDCADSFSFYSLFKAAYQTGNLGRWLNAEPEPVLTPIYQLLLNNEPSEP